MVSRRGNILPMVLGLATVVGLVTVALYQYLPALRSSSVDSRDWTDVRVALNGVIDYSFGAVQRRWCFEPGNKFTRSAGACSADPAHSSYEWNTERLLWNNSTRESLVSLKLAQLSAKAISGMNISDPLYGEVGAKLRDLITRNSSNIDFQAPSADFFPANATNRPVYYERSVFLRFQPNCSAGVDASMGDIKVYFPVYKKDANQTPDFHFRNAVRRSNQEFVQDPLRPRTPTSKKLKKVFLLTNSILLLLGLLAWETQKFV